MRATTAALPDHTELSGLGDVRQLHAELKRVDRQRQTELRNLQAMLRAVADTTEPEQQPVVEPAANGANGNAGPAINEEQQARAFLQIYHDAATLYTPPEPGRGGVMMLVPIATPQGETDKGRVLAQRIRIGDVDGMAAEAVGRAGTTNVYFAPAIIRRGVARGKRGTAEDILAHLGLAIDDDHDNGKPAVMPPIEPTAIVETCARPTRNRQPHFVFTRPVAPAEAAELAELLHRKCGGDHGTKDIGHVWRVPGTLNHPSKTKLARGRPPEPQLVRLVGGTMRPVDPAALKQALEGMPDLKPPRKTKTKPKANGDARTAPTGEGAADIDVAALLGKCSKKVVEMVHSEPEQDRSKHSFATMCKLFEKGFTDAELAAIALAPEALFARKYRDGGRQDLDAEIARVREKWTASQEEKKGQGGAAPHGGTKADMLITTALAEGVALYHAPDGTAYADLTVDDHVETWAVRGSSFKRWLRRIHYRKIGGAPSSETLETVIGTLEAQAQFDGTTRRVELRTAWCDGRIYVDMCDAMWRVIEVSAAGWRIVPGKDAPVRFRRTKGMLALPEPEKGGALSLLRKHIRMEDSSYVLCTSWILAAIRPARPYIILALAGEPGAGKSTTTRMLRHFVDPSVVPLNSMPKDERDAFIAANNRHVLAFDNLSGIPPQLADTLCKIATGGGFTTRKLFTDDEESLFDGLRPIILNSINDVATRSDLADRVVLARPLPISDEDRKTEEEVWAAFELDAPKIYGAILDVVAHGLRNLPTTKLKQKPRMADYAVWMAACETKIWKAGAHMKVYSASRENASAVVLENSAVAGAIIKHCERIGECTYALAELLPMLGGQVEEAVKRNEKLWPRTSSGLKSHLTRLKKSLPSVGIYVEDAGLHSVTRRSQIRIINTRAGGKHPSKPSSPSNSHENNVLDPKDLET